MSYCPNCGREIYDENKGCTYCGYKSSSVDKNDELILGEVINESTETIGEVDLEQNYAKNQSEYSKNGSGTTGGYKYNYSYKTSEFDTKSDNGKKLNTGIKILIVLGVFLLPGIGPIFSIISGIILMGDGSSDYKSFGRGLLILGIVLIIISAICCLFSSIGSFIIYPWA